MISFQLSPLGLCFLFFSLLYFTLYDLINIVMIPKHATQTLNNHILMQVFETEIYNMRSMFIFTFTWL